MGRLRILCSIILALCIPVVVIAASENLAYRVPDGYLYHFNDSQCVDRLQASVSSEDVADAIAAFMNGGKAAYAEGFQVYEDTGYDKLGIFDARDSYNMLVLKRMVDVLAIMGTVALALTVAIYIFLIRRDERKTLRNAYRVGAGLSGLFIVLQALVMGMEDLRTIFLRTVGMRSFAEDSKLLLLLDQDCFHVLTVLMTAVAVLLLLALTYLNHRFTRQPRIFS